MEAESCWPTTQDSQGGRNGAGCTRRDHPAAAGPFLLSAPGPLFMSRGNQGPRLSSRLQGDSSQWCRLRFIRQTRCGLALSRSVSRERLFLAASLRAGTDIAPFQPFRALPSASCQVSSGGFHFPRTHRVRWETGEGASPTSAGLLGAISQTNTTQDKERALNAS